MPLRYLVHISLLLRCFLFRRICDCGARRYYRALLRILECDRFSLLFVPALDFFASWHSIPTLAVPLPLLCCAARRSHTLPAALALGSHAPMCCPGPVGYIHRGHTRRLFIYYGVLLRCFFDSVFDHFIFIGACILWSVVFSVPCYLFFGALCSGRLSIYSC